MSGSRTCTWIISWEGRAKARPPCNYAWPGRVWDLSDLNINYCPHCGGELISETTQEVGPLVA